MGSEPRSRTACFIRERHRRRTGILTRSRPPSGDPVSLDGIQAGPDSVRGHLHARVHVCVADRSAAPGLPRPLSHPTKSEIGAVAPIPTFLGCLSLRLHAGLLSACSRGGRTQVLNNTEVSQIASQDQKTKDLEEGIPPTLTRTTQRHTLKHHTHSHSPHTGIPHTQQSRTLHTQTHHSPHTHTVTHTPTRHTHAHPTHDITHPHRQWTE